MSYLVDFLKSKMNRWNMRENKNAIIGVEIRRKRLDERLTLNTLCQTICSPSYLCKIERNQIEANQSIIAEILERMSISGKQKDLLFDFFNVLLESITAFVKNDKKTLERYINIGKGFENYRYRLLTMIYCILDDNLALAREINKEITDILSGMQDVDLLIFSVFSAIFRFKEKNYQEAIDILNSVDGLFLSDDLSYLRVKYLYLSSLMLASYETQHYYDMVIKEIIRLGYYHEIEDVYYSMSLFYLKSGATNLFNETFRMLHDDKNINSINFFIAFMNKDYDRIIELRNKELDEFSSYLVDTMSSNESKLEVIRHLSNCNDSYNFNTDLLKYFTYHTIEARISFLLSLVTKDALPSDYFVNKYFLCELAKLSTDMGHYKETVNAFKNYCENL